MDKEERKLRRKDSRRDSSKKKLSTSENPRWRQWRANGLKLPHRYRGIIGLVIGAFPFHLPPRLSTLYREFADPGYLVWISTSLSTPPRTLYTLRSSLSAPLISRIRFAPLVSLRVAHSSKSSNLSLWARCFPRSQFAPMTDVFCNENPSQNSRA